MDYITAKEAAEKWNISRRAIAYHLKDGRIPGAIKKGKLWLIPKNATRPTDKRCKPMLKQKVPSKLLRDFNYLIEAASRPYPLENPSIILEKIKEERVRLMYEAEFAYLQGDFAEVIECYKKSIRDEAALLRITPISIAAAISLGDYETYCKIEGSLKYYEQIDIDREIKVFAEFCLATAAVSSIAPSMVPNWIRTGDLSSLHPKIRPNALYIRSKYFCSIGKFDTALAIALTALTLTALEEGMNMTDLYLRMICTISYYALGQREEAEECLLFAMRMYLPHGFITPFAELVTTMGKIMEQCIEREFSELHNTIVSQWKFTFKNWIFFHNQFTKENITRILSLREYQIAVQAAHRVPYSEIAEEHKISIGRLKNIMMEIHEKLCISRREELKELIL